MASQSTTRTLIPRRCQTSLLPVQTAMRGMQLQLHHAGTSLDWSRRCVLVAATARIVTEKLECQQALLDGKSVSALPMKGVLG